MSPLFSVLIPTKNRARLLESAIRSVLGQSFRDLELIISDNNSSDDTCDVVNTFTDQRIKYVQTNAEISGPANWNHAYRQATGQYIMCIGDDDVLMPFCLETYARAARQWNDPEILYSNYAAYFPGDFFDHRQRNTVQVQKGDGSSHLVDVETALASMFSTLDVPFPTQPVLYSRSLLARVSTPEGPYHPIHPDYYCLASALLHCVTCVGVSRVLLLQGRCSVSEGVSAISTDGREVYRILEDPGVMRGVTLPLAGNFVMNGHYATLQRVKVRYPELCTYDTRHLNTYYAACDYQLRLWRSRGLKLTPNEVASEQTVRQLPLRTRAYLARRRVQRWMKGALPLALQNVYTKVRHSGMARFRLGSEIRTIEDCAAWLLERKCF